MAWNYKNIQRILEIVMAQVIHCLKYIIKKVTGKFEKDFLKLMNSICSKIMKT